MAYLLHKYLSRKHQDRNAPIRNVDGVVAVQLQITQAQTAHEPETRPAGASRTAIMKTVLLMVGLALPVILETLDYTIVATAQTHIASTFNSLNLQSYIGTVYLLTSTVFLPLFASLADIFGRHWTLQIALVLFLAGSAVSTGSHNMATMLAGRGVAGIGAAGLLACVRIILADSTSLDVNNWQQSGMFFLYTIGYCIGPYLGGALLNVSFRWIFAINLPVAAVAMIIAFFILRGRTKGANARDLPYLAAANETKRLPLLRGLLRVDWIGAILFMGAGILVLLALNWGSSEQWDQTKVIVSWVVGGIFFVAFIVWEVVLEKFAESPVGNRRSKLLVDPMIPVSLFKSLDVCIVQYATFVTGLNMLVMFYFVAIFSTIVNGLSPDKAGAQLIYFAPGMGGGSMIAIFTIKTFRQPKYPAAFGSVIQSVALGLISWAMQKNDQTLVNGFMVLAGVGVGMSIGPLAIHARFSQPEHLLAIVAALTLFFRSFGGTVGLAQCGAVLNAKVNDYIGTAIRTGVLSGPEGAALASATSSQSLSSIQSIDGLPSGVQQVIKDAFRYALKWCFISLIPWSALAAILSMFLSHIQDRASWGNEKLRGESQHELRERKSTMSAANTVQTGPSQSDSTLHIHLLEKV